MNEYAPELRELPKRPSYCSSESVKGTTTPSFFSSTVASAPFSKVRR